MIQISQADWDALARKYGEAAALLLVYERRIAEQDAEIAHLRQQLTAVVPPPGEEE